MAVMAFVASSDQGEHPLPPCLGKNALGHLSTRGCAGFHYPYFYRSAPANLWAGPILPWLRRSRHQVTRGSSVASALVVEFLLEKTTLQMLGFHGLSKKF